MHGAARCPPFCTSNPAPAPPPPPPPLGSSSSRRSLASLAFSMPRWPAVALFFCVRAISFSISCGGVGSKGPASKASRALAWRAAGACRCIHSHASKTARRVTVNMLRRQSCMHCNRGYTGHALKQQQTRFLQPLAPRSSPRQTWLSRQCLRNAGDSGNRLVTSCDADWRRAAAAVCAPSQQEHAALANNLLC